MTHDRDWENADIVGKCSFNLDFVSSQRFLTKKHFHQTESEVQRLQHNFILKNHQEILIGKKPCKDNPYDQDLEKLYKLNERDKYTK